MRVLSFLFACSVFFFSCSKDEDSTSNPASSAAATVSAESYLSSQMILPPGSFVVSPDSIQIDTNNTTTAASSGVIEGRAGEQITISYDYNSPNANITHGGIRFGETGPIHIVPITGSSGNTSGNISFPAQFPPSLCNDLSKICHEVKYYHFAVAKTGTGSYTFSKSNLQKLVAFCGNCNLPSCQSVAPSCMQSNSFVFDVTVDGTPLYMPYAQCAGVGNNEGTAALAQNAANWDDFELIVYPPVTTTRTYTFSNNRPPNDGDAEMYFHEGTSGVDYDQSISGTVTASPYTYPDGYKAIKFEFTCTLSEDPLAVGPNPKTVTLSGTIICR